MEEQKKHCILMGIVYNIHVILRDGRENQFLILLVFLLFKSIKNDVCNRAKKDYKSLKQEEILNKRRYVPVENKKKKKYTSPKSPMEKTLETKKCDISNLK